MKKRLTSNNKNLDELFAGARTEEPVMNIDEARSILHTKAGQPHATRSAHESIFSHPIKLFAIMTPAIGLLCLGLYLYLGKSMEQKQLTKLSEIHPHTAAKTVSEYDNEEAISPIVTDTLGTKKVIVITTNKKIDKDTTNKYEGKFEYFDLLDLDHCNVQTEKYRKNLVLKSNLIFASDQVDSFMKAVHPNIKSYQKPIYIGNSDLNKNTWPNDEAYIDKKLLYRFEGVLERKDNNGNSRIDPMQIRVYVNKEQQNVESISTYKTENKEINVITIKSGKDLEKNNIPNNEDVESNIKINHVPFLELDDETLNKLGIVYNDYKVLYHGEITKLGGFWKSALTFSTSPCFPPCNYKPDTALTSTFAMKARLKCVKRDFFPVFTSDRSGTTFHPLKYDNEKLTDRADFLKQANSLVPVIVKTNRKTFNMEDVVFWFAPTDEFFKILPDSIGNELAKEYKKLNRNPDTSAVASKEKNPFRQNKQINGENAGDNCKYFEVCRTNSGAITNTLIYPNPASTQFNLILGLQGSRTIKISLLDIQGKLIKELAPAVLKTDGRHSYSFQIEDINRGVYLVLIESDQGEQSIQRLVVDK